MAGVWLNTVVTYFEAMWDDATFSPKYQMYSAHDTNIASILKTIGAFNDIWPQFASTIYFELRNISNKATVNVWHKNEDILEPVVVEGCSFNCTLTKFKSVLEKFILDNDTWETECASTQTSNIDLLEAAFSEDIVSELDRLREMLKARGYQ